MKEVYCVSLGPGDPELITLKALRILKASDIIYCPGTQRGDVIVSRAGELLSVLGINLERIRHFAVPMNKDRSHAIRVYEEIAEEIKEKHRSIDTISFVAEGDSGFYSSVHYISDYLEEKEIDIQYIAGIPAFIASGAMAGLHIVKQDEPLLVLPSSSSAEEVNEEIEKGRTIVLMKLSRQEKIVKAMITQLKEGEVHYFENVGVEGKEYYTHSLKDIEGRRFPYFSLMIIKKERI